MKIDEQTDADLGPLPLLPAALREGSLSGAARSLGLTQPTVARHIDQLETALEANLFTRSPHGLAPTAVATRLAPHAEVMTSAAEALVRAAAGDETTLSGVVRVTASEVIGAEVLPPDEIAIPLETWITMHEDLRRDRRMRLAFDHLHAAIAAYAQERRP